MCLTLWWALPGDANATPAGLFGAGPESQALGGSGVSFLEGYSATYTNPAGLARTSARSFTFGVQAAHFWLEAEPGPRGAQDDEAHALLFGLTVPLPFPDPVADRLVLGLDVSAPGAAIARVRILNEARPQFPLLAPRADALNLNLGLGARLPWGLYLGVGSGLLASLQGSIGIDSGGEAARSVTDDELVTSFAPAVGLAYAPNDAWSFGLVWRSALQSAFDLNVTVQNLGSVVVPPLSVTGLASYDPAELNLEATHVWRSVRLIAGIGHRSWSALHTLRGATVQCPASEQPCGALRAHQLHLQDTWVPRLGLAHEQALTPSATLVLRAGYFFEPSPLPAQRDEARVFDNPRHAVTAGYSVQLTDPTQLSLQFAVQWHTLVPRAHAVLSPQTSTPMATRGDVVNVSWTLGGAF